MFIKFVNSEAVDKLVTIHTGTDEAFNVTVEFTTSHDTTVKNQGSQNLYSSHPDAGRRFRYAEAIVPHKDDLGTVRGDFQFEMMENSIGIIRIKPLD